MASDVAPLERITERPIAVEPAQIEDEFARIWRETAGGGVDESSMRLRVINFVGIGFADGTYDRFERVMESLPEHHPCRGILALMTADTREVEASISAHCWRSTTGGRHVCSEEVMLRGGAGQERSLASAVLALLVPDVPVAVWLIGAPDLRNVLVDEVMDAGDRVFIDSAEAAAAEAVFRQALESAREHDMQVCDLAWGRLMTWRTLIAQLFDSDDGLRELDRVESIEIVGGGGPSSEALLLGGWFISRLELSLADVTRGADSIDATMYHATKAVRMRIAGGGPAGVCMSRVTVRTASAAFVIELHEKTGHMHVREEWPDAQAQRTVARMPEDDASIFARVLDDSGEPAVYLAALRATLPLFGEPEITGTPARSA